MSDNFANNESLSSPKSSASLGAEGKPMVVAKTLEVAEIPFEK